MKNFKIIPAIVSVMVIATACNHLGKRVNSIMSYSFSNNEQKIIVHNDTMSLEIIYSGEMEFNDNETAIKRMSPGGYLEYRRNGGKLLAEIDSHGEIYYEFYNDGQQLSPDFNGKAFLTGAIEEMIAWGVGTEGRVERLYHEGGVPLLLADVGRIKADHAKKIYFEYMLKSDTITQDEMTDISKKIGSLMSSDYEKRQLLEKVTADYLDDTLTAEAYFTAVQSINSDNDKANTLKNMLKRPLQNTSYPLLLHVAGTINSDNEKANLLKEIIQNESYPAGSSDQLLKVIGTINSDNDKSAVLKTLLEKTVIKNEQQGELLNVTGKINSDNEKSNVLKVIIDKGKFEGENFNELMEVIGKINADNDKAQVLEVLVIKAPFENSNFNRLLEVMSKINSDHDKSTVFKKLTEQNINTEEQWISLINGAATISSDNDKANVLVQIAKKMPRSENIRSVYLRASKTINSDHDYARTVKDVE